MSLHDDAVRALSDWRATSSEQAVLRHRYLAHLRRHDDGWSRACVPEHLTASALVLDSSRSRVLLTLHRKAGAWFQLGGHLEPADATLAGAALREAGEESGLGPEGLELDPEPLLLDAHAVPFCGDGSTWHLDVMFVAVATGDAAPRVGEESLDVAWWDVHHLPNPELAPFVAQARARAQGLAQSSSDS